MRTTIFISFPHSCMVEFERACMRIPNRHFQVLILPPVTFPTAPHLFPKSRARTTHQTPWIDHANGLEISCSVLYVGVCNAWPPAHETTHPCPSTPWRFRSQVFSCLGASPLPGHERFLREAMGLFVLHAQIRSFSECRSQPNVPGSWDPNSVFLHPSNSELFFLFCNELNMEFP
jgi:hypothetical protein